MTPAQRDLLMKLIDVYTGYMAADIAADGMAQLKKAGVEKIAFAWAGEAERGKKHYYRVQGPTFLDRVRQHAERRQPHPLGVARLQRRLRARSAARTPCDCEALSRRSTRARSALAHGRPVRLP